VRTESEEVVRCTTPIEDAQAVRRGVTALAARARVQRGGALSTNQIAVLGLLTRVGPMTPSELAVRLRLTLQGLTRTVAALEDDALIHRASDPGDRRQSILSVSEAGRAALREDMRPRDEWLQAAMASELTDTERGLLVLASALMDRLAYLDADPAPVEP
jgi:DNA-binding MarR family transcriptional regulator